MSKKFNPAIIILATGIAPGWAVLAWIVSSIYSSSTYAARLS